jgi:hypothetical protein
MQHKRNLTVVRALLRAAFISTVTHGDLTTGRTRRAHFSERAKATCASCAWLLLYFLRGSVKYPTPNAIANPGAEVNLRQVRVPASGRHRVPSTRRPPGRPCHALVRNISPPRHFRRERPDPEDTPWIFEYRSRRLPAAINV